MTFPRSLEETPAAPYYPPVDGRSVYGERQLIGYRWFDRTGIEPLFPFGHGLGYTTFTIAPRRVTGSAGGGASVRRRRGQHRRARGPRGRPGLRRADRRRRPPPAAPARRLQPCATRPGRHGVRRDRTAGARGSRCGATAPGSRPRRRSGSWVGRSSRATSPTPGRSPARAASRSARGRRRRAPRWSARTACEPKKPLCADSGDGWADSMTWWRAASSSCLLAPGVPAPEDEHHRVRLGVDGPDHLVGERLPALALVRRRRACPHGQRGVEQQHALACPALEVAVLRHRDAEVVVAAPCRC